MKKKKMFSLLLFLTLFLFNISNVFAAREGIGVKLYVKNLKGDIISSATILRRQMPDYREPYVVFTTLPSFNTDNARTILSKYLQDDFFLSGLWNVAGFKVSLGQAKANGYSLTVDGIYDYKTTKINYVTEYRYRDIQPGAKWTCPEGQSVYVDINEFEKYVSMGYAFVGYGSHDGVNWDHCQFCKAPEYASDAWGSWSPWSRKSVTATSTRQVQTRKVKERVEVGANEVKPITTLSFDRTKIEQATKCGLTSVYKDTLTAEDVVGVDEYLDKTLGHAKYCPVYCVEENTFTYPGFKPQVDSGSHFTWTVGQTNGNNIINGLTVQLNGKRDCRTNIDLQQWLSDYNKLLKEIEKERLNLTKKPTKQTLCNSEITSAGAGTSGGWHKVDQGKYTSDSYEKPFETHTTGSGSTTNYYRYDFHLDPNNPTTTVNGKTVYNMIWVKHEAAPDACKEVNDGTLSSGWFSDASTAKNNLQSKADAECGGAFDDDYGDYSIKLTDCKESSRQNGTKKGNCKTTKKRVCDDCYGATTADGQCYDGVGCRTVTETKCEDIPVYEYQYTGTKIVRRCSYTGTSVTAKDVKTSCRETGMYTCPSGYYVYDSTTCYKSDTSKMKQLLSEQTAMLSILDECSNISLDYELETNMYVDFEEPIYDRTEKLIKNKVSTSSKENHKVMAGKKTVSVYKCKLEDAKKECWTETKDVSADWISSYGKEFNVTYEYTLPQKMYQYVLLPNGTSVDIVPNSHKGDGFQNFIDIGYSNYPVHYTTPRGLYNLDILYQNVGYHNHFEEIIRNTFPDIITSDGIITYDCEYEIDNGNPFCPPGECTPDDGGGGNGDDDDDDDDINGVRLIYRPISLLNPFPGVDGEGRTPGYNWNNTQLINKYILNNRNTNGYNVYNKEPMYTIVLTPARILDVRNYNSKTTYDDFNLKCIKGYECKSDFIRETTVGFSSYFTGCGTGNWNACDKADGFTR